MTHKFTYEGNEMRLTTDFDNGALARVEEGKPNVFDCWPYEEDEYREGVISLAGPDGEGDRRDGANFCFHFRLDGCLNRKVLFRFHIIRERNKEGETSVVYANPDFPVLSRDGRQWQRATNKSLSGGDGLSAEKIISVEQTFADDRVWIAYQYPFSNDHLSEFIGSMDDSPFCRVEAVGSSTEGRDIRQVSVTDPEIPLKDKKVAWLTGLQHSAELGAGWGLERMIEFLLSEERLAVEARRTYEFKIIPIVNVDAVAEGRGRIHSSGKNLNREWEKPHPVCDIRTIRDTMDNWKARGNPNDIFIDFHGFSSRHGLWSALHMPDGSYTGNRAKEYGRLLETIRRHIPRIIYNPNPSVGFAAGAGFRRYGALSLSVDGYVYRWPSKKVPDLSSFYESGSTVEKLSEIKASAELFVKALVEFAGR